MRKENIYERLVNKNTQPYQQDDFFLNKDRLYIELFVLENSEYNANSVSNCRLDIELWSKD